MGRKGWRKGGSEGGEGEDMHAGGERRERQRPRNEWSEEKTEKEEKVRGDRKEGRRKGGCRE